MYHDFWRRGDQRVAVLRATLMGVGLTALVAPTLALAQIGQKAQYACYVPGSGTVYRVKETNTPAQCGAGHVEFQISGGSGSMSGVAGAAGGNGGGGSLPTNGAGAYDLSNPNGFVSAGTIGTGALPVSGAGTRLMWYPRKAALRAGSVGGAHWDDANVGEASTAFGVSAKASAYKTVAIGSDVTAGGSGAMALGHSATSNGWQSVAIGTSVTSNGAYSVAMGAYASTTKKGSFVFGDAWPEIFPGIGHVQAVTENQFVVRAQRFWLGTNNVVTATVGRFLETSTGAYLSSGGTWTNSSDVNRKHDFQSVNGEFVLERLAAMPVSTWSYRDEDSTTRHMGPTAQDFRAAFGLGDTDKAIATVDADGVSLAAIKALVQRTTELRRENDELRAVLAEVQRRLTEIEGSRR